ncbi:MAG TPA: phosphotransferase, partial [Herpetosiphonaceae bacterium]
ARGRLLAALHADLGHLTDLGQRPGWRRCDDILADQGLDLLLAGCEPAYPEEAPIVRWHLERARERIARLRPGRLPALVNHGDFTAWNLRFRDGRLAGVLDFELAHWDYRIGDFALAWRGKYDEVIRGYCEAAPLEPEELALLTPMWWAYLVEVFCQAVREGVPEDGWVVKKLLERSPLMGPDAAPFR